MNKIQLFLGLVLALSGRIEAANSPSALSSGPSLFERAGSAYEAGKYAEALDLYTQSAKEDGLTAGLAYNTGNAEFRLGRRGRAAIWFERARMMAPRDADILFNLGVARSHLQDEEGTAWEFLDRIITRWELPWVVAILAWLVFGCAGTALGGVVAWRRVRLVVCVGAVLLLASAIWILLRERAAQQPWAVVVAPVAEAHSGPGDNNPVGFTVPEGRHALVTGFRPGWVEIGVPALGLKGWVREDSIERIALSEAVK